MVLKALFTSNKKPQHDGKNKQKEGTKTDRKNEGGREGGKEKGRG